MNPPWPHRTMTLIRQCPMSNFFELSCTHTHTHTHTHTRARDESQGIAVKGLRCPLGYPRSDMGHLRIIARRNGTMPRWPAPGAVRPGARAPSYGWLGSPPPEAGAPYPKKVRGGWRALPRAVAVSQRALRRRFRRARAALCMCVRACSACVHVRACGNDPSAGSPTETLL